jgi:hypothetical protein
MTERTAPDPGAIACPFVAFEGDRDERSDRPDHRHRCYAEVRPAPRAAAHQEAYCLSAGFAACPSFQDWARREAARARVAAASPVVDEDLAGLVRGSANRRAQADDAGVTAARDAESAERDDEAEPAARDERDGEAERDAGAAGLAAWTGRPGDVGPDADASPARNPQRDWAAPPPWVVPGAGSPGEAAAPGFLTPRRRRGPGETPEAEAAGLSGSRWLRDVLPGETLGDGPLEPRPERPADPDLERSLAEDRAARERAGRDRGPRSAGKLGPDGSAAVPSAGNAVDAAPDASGARPSRRSASLPTRPTLSDIRRPPLERDTAGPAWERPRRHEAFPTLKTRMRLPSLSRLTLATLALIVAAVFLFSAPFILKFLGSGTGGGDAIATPSPTPAPTASLAPTASPAPTPKVYVVKARDTISTIAAKLGLTMQELLAANPQVKNPDKIAIGDQLIIPAAAPSEIINGASPSP